MAMKDLLQYKRKLKHPYIRKWHHSARGSDTYQQISANRKRLQTAKSMKGDFYVAYQGKEYGLDEFLKKYPKYNMKNLKRRSR